jgi:hypothetical protein
MGSERKAAIELFNDWTKTVANETINIVENSDNQFNAIGIPANNLFNVPAESIIKLFKEWTKSIADGTINIIENSDNQFKATGIPANNPFNVPAESIANAEDFMLRLASLEGIPEEIREVPEAEKEALKSFWTSLVDKPALTNQLFTSLRTLRSEPNQLIPQLQFLVRQVREQMSDTIPQVALQKLEAAIQEISISISPSFPSHEEIFEAIETEVEKIENGGDVDILPIIHSLSKESKSWLGQLLFHLVQNPALEANVRAMLPQ